MAFPNDFEAPDSPPPPAYEISEQEYDLKTSHVLEASQSEPQRYGGDGEDEWEVWDEAVFTANAARLTVEDSHQAGSSRSPVSSPASPAPTTSRPISGTANFIYGAGSSSSAAPVSQPSGSDIQPLRIVKKNQSSAPTPSVKQKERPNWYAEAQLDNDDPRTSGQQGMSTNLPQPAYIQREPTPPPMFTAVADDPPYEPPPIVMTYQPGDSRPASPLESPPPPQATLPYHPPPPQSPGMDSPGSSQSPPPLRRLPRAPLPPPQSTPAVPAVHSMAPSPPTVRPQHQSTLPPARPGAPHTSTLPTASYQSRPPPPPPMSSFGPRVAFDPRVAYANVDKKSGEELPVPTKVDASAFYSSSVASLYNVPPPRRPPPPPSNMYGGTAPSQSYMAQTQPAVAGGYYNREQNKSPAPSTFSPHPSQGYQQQGFAQPGYGQGAYQQPAYQSNGYQPTSYQATSYQQTAYANTRPSWAPQQVNNGYAARPW